MGGAGGGPSKDFVGSGPNGGSPTSFDIPATELEAARPQVVIKETLILSNRIVSSIVFLSPLVIY